MATRITLSKEERELILVYLKRGKFVTLEDYGRNTKERIHNKEVKEILIQRLENIKE